MTLWGHNVVPVEVDRGQYEKVVEKVREQKRRRAFQLSEEADRERQERHERWIAEKERSDAARAAHLEERYANGELPRPDPTEEWATEKLEEERRKRERENGRSIRTSPLYYALHERLTTPELDVEIWRKSFDPHSMPDDFEMPEGVNND